MTFDLRPCNISDLRALLRDNHAYASGGDVQVYAFMVVENFTAVAGYVWQPPPPGSATSVCPDCPQGVLSLSRMVAVPKKARHLKHVSKPLRVQMKKLIDRTRWPVLVTYSDASVGHTGYVYQCSGWTPTVENTVKTYTVDGKRVSAYATGSKQRPDSAIEGTALIQRWEHRAHPDPAAIFDQHWRRVPIPGKFWRSGAQAHRYESRLTPEPTQQSLAL